MILINNFKEIKEEVNITIGTFDAIHRGHLKIINKLKNFKEKSLVLSFFPPPFIYFKRESHVLFLPNEKKDIFSNLMIDYLLILSFDEKISQVNPLDFLNLLKKFINFKRVVVGKKFRFGKDRKGDYDFLKKISKDLNFELITIDEENIGNEKISSSKIRKLVREGEIEKANELLITPFFININNYNREILIDPLKLIPPNGYYFGKIDGEILKFEIKNRKIILPDLNYKSFKLEFIKKI